MCAFVGGSIVSLAEMLFFACFRLFGHCYPRRIKIKPGIRITNCIAFRLRKYTIRKKKVQRRKTTIIKVKPVGNDYKKSRYV